MKRTLALLLALLPCLTFGQGGHAPHGAAGAVANYPPWYLAGGVVKSTCVAAWTFKGAVSQQESYTNDVAPGTYTLASGATAPTWTAASGLYFGGTAYVTSTLIPVNNQTWSAVVKFSNGASTGTHRFLLGMASATGQRFAIANVTTPAVSYQNGGTGGHVPKAPALETGILGFAAKAAYRNGVSEATIGTSVGNEAVAIDIGARNNNGTHDLFWKGYIEAVAIYNVTLTDAQMKAITEAMRLL
jgi:hypothetical protein